MKRYSIIFLALGSLLNTGLVQGNSEAPLTLDQAVDIAVNNDPWLTGSKYREQAITSISIAASSLPDPIVNIGLANLPTDGFAFDQEPMTQLKAGISQMFPRGDSLDIRSKQLQQHAAEHPLMRADRVARTRVTVSDIWLEIYRAKRSIDLIQQDRALFEQLSDIAKANYASAYGRVRQQDIVRAKLELTRLQDRLTKLRALEERATGKLLEWLIDSKQSSKQFGFDAFTTLDLPESLPKLPSISDNIQRLVKERNQQVLALELAEHPYILSINQRIQASETGVELAKEKYKPQWGINASYAFRDDTPQGASRADFLSVGVSFDLPIFTANRQDEEVAAAVSQSEAIRTDKLLALREMISGIQSLFAERERLIERKSLYDDELLLQMQEQADASLNAYTNDDGDFAEVVRARIADLNARIDALDINVDLVKTTIRFNYYFNTTAGISAAQLGEQK